MSKVHTYYMYLWRDGGDGVSDTVFVAASNCFRDLVVGMKFDWFVFELEIYIESV